MIKVYFAGKFVLAPKRADLAKRLTDDWRSTLLGDPKKLTFASKSTKLENFPIIYNGPFYCEQASEGDYTSTDCEVVVSEETRAILDSDIFCCVFDLNFSVGTIVELIDAAYAGKRIAIFYRNENSNYDIKSEYWFAIKRAMDICKENNTLIETFPYDGCELLPTLYNWLSSLTFKTRYISTRQAAFSKFRENCNLYGIFMSHDKCTHFYDNSDHSLSFAIDIYKNSNLILIKTPNKLDVKGLFDVTSNPKYLDENIKDIIFTGAFIEGTDGVGKTSVITRLLDEGIVCFDRSKVICDYMLFDVPMDKRIEAYKQYLNHIKKFSYFVVFITNNSREELESRINKRSHISEYDKMAFEYNTLYTKTYNELSKYNLENPIELVDCTGLNIDEQYEKVKSCILKRINHE